MSSAQIPNETVMPSFKGLDGRTDEALSDKVGLVEWATSAAPRYDPLPVRHLTAFYFASGLAASHMTPSVFDYNPGTCFVREQRDGTHCLIYADRASIPDELRPPFEIRTSTIVYPQTETLITLRPEARIVEGEIAYQEPERAGDTPLQPAPEAFKAFTELRRWLRLSAADAAALVGVGRTTPNSWERDGREPHPATARRLYQLHSIIEAVIRQRGEAGAILWLDTGEPSPRKSILGGRIDTVADMVEHLVIGFLQPAGPRAGALIDSPAASDVRSPAGTVRRIGMQRRSRRTDEQS